MTESSSTPVETGAASSTPTNSGNVQISQNALNGLVGEAKREAAEKERAKVSAEYDAKMQKIQEEAEKRAEQAAERKFEEMTKKRQEEHVQAQLNEAQKAIQDKLKPAFAKGAKKYGDNWKETVLSYDWEKPDYAELLPLLAQDGIDNPEEVLHHIAKEGHVEKLSSKNKAYIMEKLKQISTSIKDDEKPSVVDAPQEPIRSLKPSHTKTKGDGELTIEDFRKASWLRS